MRNLDINIAVNKFNYNDYYEILVDGISLEDLILENTEIGIEKGLVSTFLNWLDNPRERKIVWERALPNLNSTTFLPILMCGDDLDFNCTIIITECESDTEHVYWKRFGLDVGGNENMPESIGENVQWFKNSESLVFDKKQYIAILERFRSYLDEENQELCYK